MTQLAFQRVGDEQPWAVEAGAGTAILITRNPTTILWATGSPDVIPDHQPVTVYGSGGFLIPDAGMVYVIFTTQGLGAWLATTVDNAAIIYDVVSHALISKMDDLLGSVEWGIAFWWDAAMDGGGMPVDWNQY